MSFRPLIGAIAASMFVALPAAAQDKPVELKLSHWVPPSHPLQKAITNWGEAVNKSSGGSITFKVFPAQQLGKAFDHYDMARDGIADLTYVNPGYQPGRFPVIAAGELPFLLKDGKSGSQAIDDWYRKYAATEMKDVKYCFAFIHDPGTFHSRAKKIMVPDDIKGMKIRPAHATMAAFVTQLGGTNVQAGAPEVREVLEKGVADAVTFPWGSIPLFGIDKVVKFHMDVPLYATTFVWVMNKAKYDGLPAGQKKAVDANCDNAAALRFAGEWADFEAAGKPKLVATPGREVYKISAEQTTAWRKAAEPLAAKWAEGVKKANVDSAAAMKELQASLAKFKAAAE